MWTNPIAVKGVVNSFIIGPDDTVVYSEEFGKNPRLHGTKAVKSRLCQFKAGAVNELIKDAEETFSCLRPRTGGLTVLRTRAPANALTSAKKELLFVAENSLEIVTVALFAQDRISYQQLGSGIASWNSLFAFERETPSGEDSQLNTHPDETLRYRCNLLNIAGVAGFVDRQTVLLRYHDGKKKWVPFRGKIAALEPEVDSPAFIAMVEQENCYGLFRISDGGEQFVCSVPEVSPSDWQVVSILWSTACRLLVFREKNPILKTCLFLSFDGSTFAKEEISGLKNFTVYPSPAAMVGASRIDLLRGESQIWIRGGI